MKNDKSQHGHGKHMILMLLVCLVPIGIIIGLRYFDIGGSILSRSPILLMLLICPLIHLFMMKSMMGGDKGSCHGGEDNNDDKLGDSAE